MKTQTEMILSEIAKELRLIRKALEERNKSERKNYEYFVKPLPNDDFDLYLKSRDEHLQEIDEEFNND